MPDSMVDRCHSVMPCAMVDGYFCTYVFTRMQDNVFPPKFSTQICEFLLNSHVKRRTAPQQTRSL